MTKRMIAVPTAYNIYRVTDDVIQMHKAEMMMFPPVVVLETLVMQGLAKVVARINAFDMTTEDDEEELEVPDRYEMGDTPEPDNPGEEELPGPWYPNTKDDDDDEG